MLTNTTKYFNRSFFLMGPSTDIKTNKNFTLFEIELPGVTKEDVKINIDEDLLEIKANKKTQNPKDFQNIHSERDFGEISRSFTLPRGSDLDSIEALIVDGVLTIKIPKLTKSKIKIKI